MENISSYGCVKIEPVSERVSRITDMVEKPRREEAPSNLAIIGRYILTPDIFPILEKQQPGKGGEIQITDAILSLSKTRPIYGCRFEGTRHDCGDKLGFLKATIELALKRSEFTGELTAFLKQKLESM